MDPAETAPAEVTPQEPTEPAASPESPAAETAGAAEEIPGWFRDYHERNTAELNAYRGEFERARAEANDQRQWLLRTLDPEGYKTRTAPTYVTKEHFDREMENRLGAMRDESRTQAMMGSFGSEYRAAIETHTELAKAIGESRFEGLVIDEWGRNPSKSVKQIVEGLDQAFQREFERRQAAWSQGKQELAGKTKAPMGKGSPPPPASNAARTIREAAANADFSQYR